MVKIAVSSMYICLGGAEGAEKNCYMIYSIALDYYDIPVSSVTVLSGSLILLPAALVTITVIL